MPKRESINYYVGGAMLVKAEAERVTRQMDDLIRYLRQDDGHGFGNAPEHAVEAASNCLKAARSLSRELRVHREYFRREAAKRTNPRGRRR